MQSADKNFDVEKSLQFLVKLQKKSHSFADY